MDYSPRISLLLRILALACIIFSLVSCLMNDLWYQYTVPTTGFIFAIFALTAIITAIAIAYYQMKFIKIKAFVMFPVKVAVIVVPMILCLLTAVFFALSVQVCITLFADTCFLLYNSPTLTTAMVFSAICFCVLLAELILLLCTAKQTTEEVGTQTALPMTDSDTSSGKSLSAEIINPQFKQAFIARRPAVQTDL